MHGLGDLLQSGISPQLGQQPLVYGTVVLQRPTELLPNTVGSRLQKDRFRHVEPNPVVPVGVIIPLPVALNGLPQPEAPLLNQIQQEHPAADVIFGDFQNPVQPQIGQRLHSALIRCRTPCRQRLLVPGSGKLRHLF